MKALEILGGIGAVLALAVAVFWFGWLRPAPAEDVCENIAEVTKKETGTELPDDAMKECVARYSRTPEFGLMPWAKQTKCIAGADTLAEMDACGKRS